MADENHFLKLTAEQEADAKARAAARKQVAEEAAGTEEERLEAKEKTIEKAREKKGLAIIVIPKEDADAVKAALLENERARVTKIKAAELEKKEKKPE